jgi:hypothetical protein
MKWKLSIIHIALALALCVHLVSCSDNDFDAHSPAVSYDASSGQYLTVYSNNNADHHTSRITGRFIDSEGAVQGGEFTVAESGNFNFCTALGHDSVNARFFAVWESSGLVGRPDSGSGPPVLNGQFINADGTLFGPLITLSTAELDIGCPAVAFDDSAQAYLILWGEQQSSEDRGLQALVLSAAGDPIGAKLLISDDVELGSVPSIAYDGVTGRFLAAWLSSDDRVIKGRFINPDGSFAASKFTLSSFTGTQSSPSLVFDGINSRYFAAWTRREEGSDTGSLKGLLLNADGTQYRSTFDVSSAGRNVVPRPSAVFDAANANYYVVFGVSDSEVNRIYGQVVSAAGDRDASVSAENILLSYLDFSGDERPKLAYDSVVHRFYAIWTYGPVEQGNKRQQFVDIHGRLVNADGTAFGQITVLSNGGR